jgi:hypothetical protein
MEINQEIILEKKIPIENITFDMSINSFRPLYYHFLDGFLNPDTGSSMEVIRSIIKHYDFIVKTSETIKIWFLQMNNDDFLFYNIQNKPNKPITYDFILEFITNPILDDKWIDFLQKLEYCIYHVANNKHATSILIQCKNNKCIISCFNSGMGIENHSHVTIDGVKYFKPSKDVILSDDIEKDKIGCIKKILIILLLPEYYKLIEIGRAHV